MFSKISGSKSSVQVEISEEIDLRRQIHDLKGAARTLELCLISIEKGYRFDDDLAEPKIKALRRAFELLSESNTAVIDILENSNTNA